MALAFKNDLTLNTVAPLSRSEGGGWEGVACHGAALASALFRGSSRQRGRCISLSRAGR
jgi:hypothetical protein